MKLDDCPPVVESVTSIVTSEGFDGEEADNNLMTPESPTSSQREAQVG